jgi:hypothetical protein
MYKEETAGLWSCFVMYRSIWITVLGRNASEKRQFLRIAKQKEGMEVETRVFTISNDQGIYVD